MSVLIEGLESAFCRFGGVPQELLFDQMGAVVVSDDRSSGGGLACERPVDRFERGERQALRLLASCPYRRLGARRPEAASRRRFGPPMVQVQRRPLREYSEAVR